MSLISILLGIVFFVLLAKAIFETIWGTCLIIFGLACHAFAFLLDGLAFMIRTFNKIVRLFRKPKPAPRKTDVAGAICMYFSNIK
jgi:hypothetical protein